MNQPEKYICAQFSRDGKVFAIGTDSSALHVFRLNNQFRGGSSSTNFGRSRYADTTSRYIDHLATLSGHSKAISCIYISTAYSTIVSGSEDHNLIFWDSNRQSYIRSICHEGPVTCCAMSEKIGDVASFCTDVTGKHYLYLWNINGMLIASRTLHHALTCMRFTDVEEGVSRNVIVCGLVNGTILIVDAFDLKTLSKLKINDYSSPVTALMFNSAQTEIVSGDDKGIVVTWGITKN
jgi:WD40 repeat protein